MQKRLTVAETVSNPSRLFDFNTDSESNPTWRKAANQLAKTLRPFHKYSNGLDLRHKISGSQKAKLDRIRIELAQVIRRAPEVKVIPVPHDSVKADKIRKVTAQGKDWRKLIYDANTELHYRKRQKDYELRTDKFKYSYIEFDKKKLAENWEKEIRKKFKEAPEKYTELHIRTGYHKLGGRHPVNTPTIDGVINNMRRLIKEYPDKAEKFLAGFEVVRSKKDKQFKIPKNVKLPFEKKTEPKKRNAGKLAKNGKAKAKTTRSKKNSRRRL